MWVRCVAILALTLCAAGESGIPEIGYSQLKSALTNTDWSVLHSLKDSGGKFSVISIVDIPSQYRYGQYKSKIIREAPKCLSQNQSLPVSEMADGSTRRTWATSGTSPEDLPECLSKDILGLGMTFDSVEFTVTLLIQQLVNGSKDGLHYVSHGKTVPLIDAPHKDHLHVYESKLTEGNSHNGSNHHLVPFHVDNGMFLVITPFKSLGLKVKLSDGTVIQTSDAIEDDSVLVLFGLGLSDWLLQGSSKVDQFYPVPHAVESMKSKGLISRVVYARMKVAPSDAVPSNKGQVKGLKLRTFREVFMKSFKESDSRMCSVELNMPFSKSSDKFHNAMNEGCSKGEAYCWMSCMALPEACPSEKLAHCFSKKNNLTCSTTGEKPMDPTCQWECKPEEPKEYTRSSYCNGKMDMLMSGFDSSGKPSNPCIILFIESWTLDSPVKFGIGCIGVMVLGFSIEALIAFRRNLTRRKRLFVDWGQRQRKFLVVFSFGLNLVLGYLAMLVAMTYSIELFFFVVLGLIIGHAVFNADSAVGESVDPCCVASQNDLKSKNSGSKKCMKPDQYEQIKKSKPMGEAEEMVMIVSPSHSSSNNSTTANNSLSEEKSSMIASCCPSKNKSNGIPNSSTQQTFVQNNINV